MSEWKEYKLGEVCSRLRSGKNLKSNLIFPEGKYPVWGGNGVRGYTNECNFSGQCCVIGRQGAYCGNVHYYKGEAYMTEHAIVAVGNEQANTYYLACALSLMHLENLSAQSAQPGISVQTLSTQTIILPPIDEQKLIAGVLCSLDDKIDLLHRENATLEALAETLFRHYFIENPNPEWKEGKLTDFIKIIGGGTPKTNEPSYWNGDIGWLSGGDISENHKNYILNVEKYITQKGVDNSSVNVMPENSMIISARGTVGKYCLLGRPMAFSQSNYGILPKIDKCYFFTYLLVSRYVEEMKNAAYGSVFDTITTKTFESIDVFLPNEKEVMVVFDNQVKPIFEKLKRNQLQIQSMLSQRDTLLPRLMSGEVKINE